MGVNKYPTSFWRSFILLLVGIIAISLMGALQYVVPADTRLDIANDSIDNLYRVQLDQSKVTDKGFKILVKEDLIYPYLHFAPPLFALALSLFLAWFFNDKFFHNQVRSDIIAPYSSFFVAHSIIFVGVCVLTALIEKDLYQHLSYGFIPAVYHSIAGVVAGFSICINGWKSYQDRLNTLCQYKSKFEIDKLRKNIESTFRIINRSSLLLAVTIALGTWRILGDVFGDLQPAEKSWHSFEIMIDFLVCAGLILLLILMPLFNIFQNVDKTYFDKAVAKLKE